MAALDDEEDEEVRRCEGCECECEWVEKGSAEEKEERGWMSQEAWWVEEVVDVAESRESERDMATEAGAKVEGRMFEDGEEKKCMFVRVMGGVSSVCGGVGGVLLECSTGPARVCCALGRGCCCYC